MAKYDESFWRRVVSRAEARRLMGTLKRLVENQEQKVTLSLTDNLAEHEALEQILEASKPSIDMHPRIAKFDYLLRAPWRYPPLKWGSRFGRRFEPSIFYGALSKAALYSEAAYYRLLFLDGMKEPFKDRVISQFTVFEAMYQADAAYDLTGAPFARHAAVLRHKSDYGPCQRLGSVLREREVQAVTYWSARAKGDEQNVALFSPTALRSLKHRSPRHGICETTPGQVSFRVAGELYEFPAADFKVDGRLPLPASS